MTGEDVLLAAIVKAPGDDLAWLALADWLEEDGQPDRAELLRLTRRLRGVSRTARERPALEARLCALLGAGVRPSNPEFTNSIGMRFRLIPPGKFVMGAPESEEGSSASERPLHEVEITRPFWLGVFPVTQAQYEAVTGYNPSWYSATGDGSFEVDLPETHDFPVEYLRWEDAVEYARLLSERPEEKLLRRQYRLPSEAEWEYACRGGPSSYSPFPFGRALNGKQACCDGTHPYGTSEEGPLLVRPCVVGTYPANAFGLHDMIGNVWEWCADWYGEDYYQHSPAQGPPGPSEGYGRVIRGGAFYSHGDRCRSGHRHDAHNVDWGDIIGFRLALTVSSE